MQLAHRLRIVIPGGTGRLGSLLARHFHDQGHLVSTITRFPKPSPWEAVHWDAEHLGHWVSSIEDADVVINLAASSIIRARIRTTHLVTEAISQCVRAPRVWLNASTTDIYCESFDSEVTEQTGELATSSSSSQKDWESAAFSVPTPGTRKILIRLGPVMTPESGAFDVFLRLVRLGLGGEMGNGRQYVDWVHDFDFIRAIEFLIERDDIEGAVNITSPFPLPNRQLMCNLRRAWCTSYFGLPVPAWLVELASFIARSQPEFVLKSRRVVPGRLLEAGFSFHFPEWRGAAENLVQRWRQLHEV